ncbi:MAG: twin-arginine translocation signal domain-containing protein [Candidatus Nanohaloarchaea archaeon]
MDKEEIEELIEKKIEEKLDERGDNKEPDSFIGKEIERKIEEKKEEEGVDRRSFLKMLGLGAGGLALSSQASALFKLTSPPKKSNINADTLDGSNLSDLAGNQLSLNSGSLDVQEGSGSGLNADTVDGKHASNLGGLSSGDFYAETASSTTVGQTAVTTITPTTSLSKYIAQINGGNKSGYDLYYQVYHTLSYGTSGGSLTYVKGKVYVNSFGEAAANLGLFGLK